MLQMMFDIMPSGGKLLRKRIATQNKKQEQKPTQVSWLDLFSVPLLPAACDIAEAVKGVVKGATKSATDFLLRREEKQSRRAEKAMARKEASKRRMGNAIAYIDGAIEVTPEIHEWVLFTSVRALTEAENAEEKLEILEWIYAPDYIERLGKTLDAKPCIVRRHVHDIPYSFANCCRMVGADKDDFREMLLNMFNPKLRALMVEYVKQLTRMEHVPVIHHRRNQYAVVYKRIHKPNGFHQLVGSFFKWRNS